MRIKCDGAKCFVTEIERLASGAINYFTAKFTFDNAWALFTEANQLYAVFEGSDAVIISNLIYNTETQSYDCEIPWQTMIQEGELHVGAIGHITTPEVKILTTNMAFAYRIPKGAATVGDNISDPSGLLLNILDAADNVQANLTKSNIAISHWPIIDSDTQNWFRWDTLTEKYVDTGTSAVGRDLTILGHYDTYSLLEGGVTSPNIGDIYTVGTVSPYTLYIYDGILNSWKDYGPILAGGSGSSDEMVTQVDFDAHIGSQLMHKPTLECETIGTVCIEGYKNKAGYTGVYYSNPSSDSSEPIVATATPNEYLITFNGARPYSIINESIVIQLSPSWMKFNATVVALEPQTITIQCMDEIAAGESIASIYFKEQPANSYIHVEGCYNIAEVNNSHAEGAYNLITRGYPYIIDSCDDVAKTITLLELSTLMVGDSLRLYSLGTALLTGIEVVNVDNKIITLNTTESLEGYYLAIKNEGPPDSSSHVEGKGCVVTGYASHGEGLDTLTSGNFAHSEGYSTSAYGHSSHAEGLGTKTYGYGSHAEGYFTQAKGQNSHAQGESTIAEGNEQTVLGRFNIPDLTSLLIIGNGQSEEERLNLLTIGQDGWIRTSGAKTAIITTEWVGETAPYTQEVIVNGITVEDEPIIYPIYSTETATALLEEQSWNMISDITTDTNKIIVRCLTSKPNTIINIKIKGV